MLRGATVKPTSFYKVKMILNRQNYKNYKQHRLFLFMLSKIISHPDILYPVTFVNLDICHKKQLLMKPFKYYSNTSPVIMVSTYRTIDEAIHKPIKLQNIYYFFVFN